MGMKWRLIIILCFLLIGALWLLEQKPTHSNTVTQRTLKESIHQQFQKLSQSKLNEVIETTNQLKATEELTIQNWIKSESMKMDTDSFDPIYEESKLRKKAAGLTEQDIFLLKKISLDSEVSANERILSTYILSLSSTQSLQALQEIATAELSIKDTPQPHSLDETQSMHEKALRRMAIDELFNRAMTNPEYRDKLLSEIKKIQIPELKAYAENRFQELFG